MLTLYLKRAQRPWASQQCAELERRLLPDKVAVELEVADNDGRALVRVAQRPTR